MKIKDSIQLFGFKSGFKFWFKWSISDPIKIFYWKYIVAKPLCTNCGYFLCNPNCKAKKITGRKNIIRYEKERHKQIEIEAKIVRGSEDGICFYCGKEKGTEEIDDPNWDTLEKWLVCKNCKEIIENQRRLSFGSILTGKTFGKEIGEKMMMEANDALYNISQKIGKPITNISIYKTNEGYKTDSVTFTGRKNDN